MGLIETDITFENAHGRRLVGTIHRAAEPVIGGAVICHGMLSHRASTKHRAIACELANRGVTTLRFDFYGRGQSDGRTEEITYEGQLLDVDAAVNLVRREVERVALVGSSMGGAVAILHAARDREICCVATVAAVAHPADVALRLGGSETEERWRRDGYLELLGHRLGYDLLLSARRVDVIDAAGSLECPLLVIHGALDEVVPVEQARELAEVAAQAELCLLPRGDHRLHGAEEQEELVWRIGRFVGREIAGSGPSIAPLSL